VTTAMSALRWFRTQTELDKPLILRNGRDFGFDLPAERRSLFDKAIKDERVCAPRNVSFVGVKRPRELLCERQRCLGKIIEEDCLCTQG
jgi:hypothetical protein